MDQKAFSQPFEGLEILFNTRYQNDENWKTIRAIIQVNYNQVTPNTVRAKIS